MRECSRRAGQAVNGYLDWGRRNRHHGGVRGALARIGCARARALGRTRATPRGL